MPGRIGGWRLGFTAAGLIICLLATPARAQIGGAGWSPGNPLFKVQWPYNTPETSRYTQTNGIYHFLVYSNDMPFMAGNTTLPRTEQRFTPDYTRGEIQYQARIMVPPGNNKFSVFQIHTGDAQSHRYGATTFMLFWQADDGGSVHDYSRTELARDLAGKWFQLNVDHNLVNRTITVWINRKKVWSQRDNGAGDYYFKDGVYTQHGASPRMDDFIANDIRIWTCPGTNTLSAPYGASSPDSTGPSQPHS